MLYGLWEQDLKARVTEALGRTRGDAIGEVDISANPFASSAGSGAALYDRTPKTWLETADEAAEKAMQAILRRAGIWAQMQRTQRDILGMREMLVKVEVLGSPETGLETNYMPVSVDMVHMRPDPEQPERPIEVKHAVRRKHWMAGNDSVVWTWDVWNIEDPAEPYHRVMSAEGGRGSVDLSEHYGLPVGGETGDAYKAMYSYQDGAPFLPFALYHAARTGRLLDSFFGLEIVEGTLNVGVMWTFFGHCVRNASWPQRYTINAQPAAESMGGGEDSQRVEVVADPAFVLQLVGTEDGVGQPVASQWTTSTDPKALAESIGIYERRLAAYADLDPSDVRRVSGDPRSGYAIAIGREGKREAQRKYAPVFSLVDEELMGITAALHNRAAGNSDLPERGWRIEYQALPSSPEELEAMRTHALALLDAQLITEDEARKLMGLEPKPKQTE